MNSYHSLNAALEKADIAFNLSELHGFLSGLLCGGLQDQSWLTLLYQVSNDGHAYPTVLVSEVSTLYQSIQSELSDAENFDFEPLILGDEASVFARADNLSEWANQFLLGLGLSGAELSKQQGEIAEALDDLQNICQLGYEEDDDEEELSEALEEIIEYLRTLAMLFYSHFNPAKAPQKLVLH